MALAEPVVRIAAWYIEYSRIALRLVSMDLGVDFCRLFIQLCWRSTTVGRQGGCSTCTGCQVPRMQEDVAKLVAHPYDCPECLRVHGGGSRKGEGAGRGEGRSRGKIPVYENNDTYYLYIAIITHEQ